MKNKHPKRKLAMSMMTQGERERKISPFDSYAWSRRKSVRLRKECLRSKYLNTNTVMKKFKNMFKAYKLA